MHEGAADIISSNKIQFGKRYLSQDGWEIIFAPPKAAGTLPAIKHARQQAKRCVVTQFFAVFLVSLRVRSGNGAVWKLDVEHSYRATNLDVPNEFQLRLNFTIVGHRIEA